MVANIHVFTIPFIYFSGIKAPSNWRQSSLTIYNRKKNHFIFKKWSYNYPKYAYIIRQRHKPQFTQTQRDVF
ncbi:MAG: hypothetical protein CMH27_09105 [Micavibrio sp.]|nr:hypothetical protein [Micavibrio sp.]